MGVALLVVDAANVVGSVPDGWWRDRAGATVRLRDSLEPVCTGGLGAPDAPDWLRGQPVDVVLVVEGAASGVPSAGAVQVVAAPGSGDDAIVEVVRTERGDRPCAVVTADRALRERVATLGAVCLGPRMAHPATATGARRPRGQ